ncbi:MULTISPECIES: type IV toxin-antitoxin system AbiEi family antitoxin domain-containing protein [unclassified Breznakia]|uniref:type IV toxin-antitoxin system AbiEi family antitoxin domain-containing protein n=1 Tax=unclassified Breznakia TaxID=2623764 RepID=UPI0024736B9C|nr:MULTISPECIES: type IV toxin-antitoxin system AbiEi family antitoxin domain-containing protein [unclassified Breznakia]MDH6367961.1 putative transcriptional regulator of viral defense system [Breznakia sp. PH1-1]MDH6405049.1 putative transcriptional regulator of viral defense system [Breznakia sp. PF1-11]MDH6412782.1 putative transcriptional regulator of viral defense system [Breznakia sp. PFB1-11]MDH6415124.1 putative transcriptional regulator of viral defense system [Breznakia sp. PFB1-14]
MNQAEKVLNIANQNNGIITTRQVTELGIGRWVLQTLERLGKIYPVQRGVYVTESGYADDFFLLQERYPKGIYSHETALYLLGFSDRAPIQITMAFEQGTSTVRMKVDNIRPVMISNKDKFEVGVTSVQRPGGTEVTVYEIERVLVDLMKPKYNADLEQVIPAFKRYAASKKKDVNKLFRYARMFGVEDKVRSYMILSPLGRQCK